MGTWRFGTWHSHRALDLLALNKGRQRFDETKARRDASSSNDVIKAEICQF